MNNSLVSVCIGTYNREHYIRECLDSVLAQTWPNIEIIVVDDHSTDRTVEYIQSYGDRVRVFIRSTNSGIPAIPRNHAIEKARGDYISFLDSDDIWYPEKIQKQVELMVSNPSIALSHTSCMVINHCSESVGVRHQHSIPETGYCFKELLKQCFITTSSVMVNTKLCSKIGYFNESPFFRIGEDYEFFLRVAAKHPIGFINETLAGYRKSKAGITADNWLYTPRVFPFHRWLLRHPAYWDSLVSKKEILNVLVADALENSQYWRDSMAYKQALYFALQAVCYNPRSFDTWSAFIKALLKKLVK